ncbi:MAG: hypothetical protein LBS27_07525 [Bifidobacteriaceae bacterium]|jgi:hypothetical protein|nr:hypothetical protein [Bifidobacteriaceae bacterium]
MRLFKHGLLATGAVLTAAALLFSGTTGAKWSSGTETEPQTVANEANEVYLQHASTHTPNKEYASKTNLDLELEFTAADAADLRQASEESLRAGGDGFAVWGKAVAVKGTAYGTAGFGYEVSLPTLPNGYSKNLRLFRVAGQSECIEGAQAGPISLNYPSEQESASSLSESVAISTDYKPKKPKVTFEQWYCLIATFTPTGYSNTASVRVNQGSLYGGTDTWGAWIYPDAAAQPTVTYKFTVKPLGG